MSLIEFNVENAHVVRKGALPWRFVCALKRHAWISKVQPVHAIANIAKRTIEIRCGGADWTCSRCDELRRNGAVSRVESMD
jgi:hypothetical protein